MDSLLGAIYIQQRRYVEASVHLLDALHIFDNLKYVDPSIVSDLFMTLSQLNFDQAKYTESIQCLELAMERLSVLPDKGGGRRATVLSNLALNYEVSGRLEEAIMAYDESLHELKQLLGNEHPKVLQLEQYYLDLLRRMGQ